MSSSERSTSASAEALAGGELAALRSALADDDPAALPEALVQRLLALAVRSFAGRAVENPVAHPFPADGAPTNTDVALAASAMLDAVGIEIFELGLWRSWGPRATNGE